MMTEISHHTDSDSDKEYFSTEEEPEGERRTGQDGLNTPSSIERFVEHLALRHELLQFEEDDLEIEIVFTVTDSEDNPQKGVNPAGPRRTRRIKLKLDNGLAAKACTLGVDIEI